MIGSGARYHDLHYMHARYYNLNLGRFLSVDPVSTGRIGKSKTWNRYAYAWNNPVNLIDPYGEDVSIRLTFKGDAWTDEDKAAVIAAVNEFWTNLDVGDVYVFDSAKMNQANQTLFFGGTAAITVHSSATGDAHSGFVPAGTYRKAEYSAAEQAQAIANVINHEIFSHQFSFSDFSTNDRIAYDRKYQAGAPPEVRERYGTIVDGAAWTDPATRKRIGAGSMPVHSEDARKAGRLKARNLDPPSPGPNRWWKVW